ncbi:MAG: hypothetical protein JSW11_00255 [Candidatus Heimdallarchaeota archaeon]|nr:MAG: hypothetical protein JSW11_00255 [Candidatus Heimdallarchaeota archaeon]
MAIIFGNKYEINSSGTKNLCSTKLDSSKFIVAYSSDESASSGLPSGSYFPGRVRVGTLSNPTEIFFDDEIIFEDHVSHAIDISALNSSGIILSYEYVDDIYPYSHNIVRLGTVSGTDVTFGSGIEFNAPGSGFEVVGTMPISPSSFIVFFHNIYYSPFHGNIWVSAAKIGEISGSTITFGNAHEFVDDHTTTSFFLDATLLSPSSFVLAHSNHPSNVDNMLCLCTISGTTISSICDIENNYYPKAAGAISLASLDESRFIIAHYNQIPAINNSIRIGTIDGSTITLEEPLIFTTSNDDNVVSCSVSVLPGTDSSHTIISYAYNKFIGPPYRYVCYANSKIATIDGTSIILSNEYEFDEIEETSHIYGPTQTTFDTNNFALCYVPFNQTLSGICVAGFTQLPAYGQVDLFLQTWKQDYTTHYVEEWRKFNLPTSGSWVDLDLSDYIPSDLTGASIVAHMLISNTKHYASWSGGVRTPGSQLERCFYILQSGTFDAQDGENCCTLHVQTSGGKIECFAENAEDLDFYLIGYWLGPQYTETMGRLEWDTDLGDTSFGPAHLSSFGVPGDVFAEVMIEHKYANGSWVGVREVGSTNERKLKCNAGQGALEQSASFATTCVKTSGVSGTIELARQYNDSKWSYILPVGYWSVPPGDYTELFIPNGANPINDAVWETVEVSGVPSGAVADVMLGHRDLNDALICGIKTSGNQLERKFNLCGVDALTDYGRSNCNMLVNTHSGVVAYSEQASTPRDDFTIMGYWSGMAAYPNPINNNITLFMESLSSIKISGDLFIHGGNSLNNTQNLFIWGNIGGDYIYSGKDLFIYGRDSFDDTHNLFILGDTGIDSIILSSDLFIGGQELLPSIRTIDHLIRMADHNPQLIGAFDVSVTSVNIEIWNIGDGQNLLVPIVNSGCYAIGNTGRWGWSTEYLPFVGYRKYHYYFRMTSNTGDKQYGEFLIRVPENNLFQIGGK